MGYHSDKPIESVVYYLNKHRNEEKSSFLRLFLVLNILAQGEERNIGEYCFIQFVSLLVQEKRSKIPLKIIHCSACNPPGIKNLRITFPTKHS